MKKFSFKKQLFLQSTAVRIILLIIALLMPFNVITIVLMRMTVSNSQRQVEKEIQNALDMNVFNFTQQLQNVSRREIYLCINSENSEFQELSTALDSLNNVKKGNLIRKVVQDADDLRQEHSIADLVWFSFPQNGYVVTSGAPGIQSDAYRELIDSVYDPGKGKGMQWSVDTLDDTMVLYGSATWNKIHCGILLNLERTLPKLGQSENKGGKIVFFTNTEETIFSQEGTDFFSDTGLSLEQLKNSRDYQVYLSPIDDFGVTMVEINKRESTFGSLPVPIRVLEVISLILVFLSMPILLFFERRWLIHPLKRLTGAIEIIEKGDLDYRIEENCKSMEFTQINKSFNRMMDQVSDLKIHVYEVQLEKQQIKMKFLSQQIQPHFILNTLNILYSYEQEEYPLIQKMILLLSRYFRYIVNANSDFVTLKEEMDHIRNYFDIQQVRYPETFFAMVEYAEEIEDCLVPPLLIQNFAENSIKHSIRIGNHIDIFVIAQKYDEEHLRIRMLDTGEGINETTLKKIKLFQETGEHQPGLGIGIQNAIERLKVLYGLNTSFEIGRDEPHGTRISIILPIHHAEDEDED